MFQRLNQSVIVHQVPSDYEPVQSNLSVTPAEMLKMAELGHPISAQSLGMESYDGYKDIDFDVPLEHQRGVDITDMFMSRQDAKRKLKMAIEQSHDITGVSPQNV